MHSSREGAKPRRDIEEIARIVMDTAFQLHKDLGPELLESVYADEGFRLDLLVDKQRIVELKSVEKLHPVHPKQLQTHLRLIDISLGLLINFGVPLI